MKKYLMLFILTLTGCSTSHYEENNKTIELSREYFIGKWSCVPKQSDPLNLFSDMKLYREYEENGVLKIEVSFEVHTNEMEVPLTVNAKTDGVWMRDPFITDITEFHHKFSLETNNDVISKQLTQVMKDQSILHEMIYVSVEPHSDSSMIVKLPSDIQDCEKVDSTQ